MFDIKVVLQKASMLDMVSKAGGKLVKHGDRYSCACPLHGGENQNAFSVFQGNGKMMFKCFTDECGSGDSITFAMKWQKLDFKEACEFILGEKIDDAVAWQKSAEQRLEEARIETIAAQEREDARRKELQLANRHIQYHNNLSTRKWMSDIWAKWGIDEGMQDFWKLGGCDDFFVDREYHPPTLTIPIMGEFDELMTIRHRILTPRNPKDKYRPDRTGLHAWPFLAVPEMGFNGELIWVMEGEKKAMVTWTRADTEWQCIGVPGQEMYKHLIEKLRKDAKRVIVVPDPNAESKALAMAKEIGARFLQIPQKIDDLILNINATKDDLFQLQKQARCV